MKTENVRKLAIQQLIKRLSIIRCALQHLFTDQELKRIAIFLECIIYLMVEGWSSPDEDEIVTLAEEIGILVEKDSNISVVTENLR